MWGHMPLMPPAMLCSLPPSWAKAACSHQQSCNTAGQEPWAERGPELPSRFTSGGFLFPARTSSSPLLRSCRPLPPLSPSLPPCLAPIPQPDSTAAPELCRSTFCPSSPALHRREGPLPSQLHGGTSATPLPSPPTMEVTAGEVREPRLLHGAACSALPAHLPVALCLPAAHSPPLSAGPGCLLFSFALQRRGRAMSSDLGFHLPMAMPPTPEDPRVGAVTVPPFVVCPPHPLWQGLRLPEQPPLPCAAGPPCGHRQREG